MLKVKETGLSRSWVVTKKQGAAYTGGAVALGHDGSYALCMCNERVAQLDLASGTVAKLIPGGELPEGAQETITAFAASPVDGTLVTCSRNLLMRVWDVATGECRRSWRAHRSPVLTAAYEASGTLVATGGTDRAVFVWDVDNGYATHSFRGHAALVTAVAFLPHPHSVARLASGGEDGVIMIWDLVTQTCVAAMKEHFSAVTALAFSPDPHGYTMLTGGRDAMINIWDTRDFDAPAGAAAGSSSGAAAAAPVKPEVRAQVTTHEAVEAVVVLPTADAAGTSAAPAPGHHHSASGTDFVFFTAGEKGVLRKWRLQVAPGKDAKAAASRRYIVGTLAARTVPQLRAASAESVTGDEAEAVTDTPSAAAEVASKALAVSADAVPVARQFGALLLRRVAAVAGDVGANAAAVAAAASSKKGGSKRKRPADEAPAVAGSRYELLAVTRDHVLTLLTAGGLGHVKTVVGHSDDVVDVAYLPRPLPVPADALAAAGGALPLHRVHARQLVAVATNSEQLRLMDVDDFSTTLCDGHGGIILSLSASPDGALVATASKDGTARVWDVATGACVAVCEGHTEAVSGVAWPVKAGSFMHAVPAPLDGAPAGAKPAVVGATGWLATVSKDRTVKLWQLGGLLAALPSPRPAGWSVAHLRRALGVGAGPDGAPVAPLRPRALAAAVAHEKDINAVAVAPNDRLLATGSQDKAVKLWTAPDLLPVATLSGHKRGVWAVAFSPTDQLLASASGDRTIRLWSVARAAGYACVRTLEGHDASVLAVRFLPAGTQLVSAGADGLLKLWTVADGACGNTFEGHGDKVWALAVRPQAAAAAEAPKAVEGEDEESSSSSSAAAAAAAPAGELITGGSDSVLAVWRDATQHETAAEVAAAEEAVARSQALYAAMATRDYPGAVSLALELQQPGRVGDILQELLEEGRKPALAGLPPSAADDAFAAAMLAEVAAMDVEAAGGGGGSAAPPPPRHDGEATLLAILGDPVALPPRLLGRLLGYAREWNTQSRHGLLAQRLLHLLLRALPQSRLLAALAAARAEEGASRVLPGLGAVRVVQTAGGGGEGGAPATAASGSGARAELRSLVTALLPYSERHAERLDRLGLSAYLADYTLDAMTVLAPEDVGLSREQADAMTAGLDRRPVRAVLAAPGAGGGDDSDGDSEGDSEGGDASRLRAGGGWGAATVAAPARRRRAPSDGSATDDEDDDAQGGDVDMAPLASSKRRSRLPESKADRVQPKPKQQHHKGGSKGGRSRSGSASSAGR